MRRRASTQRAQPFGEFSRSSGSAIGQPPWSGYQITKSGGAAERKHARSRLGCKWYRLSHRRAQCRLVQFAPTHFYKRFPPRTQSYVHKRPLHPAGFEENFKHKVHNPSPSAIRPGVDGPASSPDFEFLQLTSGASTHLASRRARQSFCAGPLAQSGAGPRRLPILNTFSMEGLGRGTRKTTCGSHDQSAEKGERGT